MFRKKSKIFKYIINKFIILLITLWVIVTSVFFIMKTLPGGPFDLENEIPANLKLEIEKKYDLDKPIGFQYIKYIANIIKLDFGNSYKESGVEVSHIIKRSFKYSAYIGFFSVAISIFLGIIFGVVFIKNYFINQIISSISTFGIAIPNFILAIFFICFFGERYGWVPVGNLSLIRSYIGPILVLSIYPASFIVKITRSNMTKILKENYIRVLNMYGVSKKKILFKYALKAVLAPVVTYTAPMFSSIIMGSFAVEKIFAIPGLGKVFIDSVVSRDYNVVLGLILFYASVYLLAIFITDICYFALEPRLVCFSDIEPNKLK